MVHNDIELHWSSFVTARRILACALAGAIHFVQDGGSRLTNQRGAERLEVFRSFEKVMPRITGGAGQDRMKFLQPFTRFSCDLIGWISHNIDADKHPELLALSRNHFLNALDRQLIAVIADTNPPLAKKINQIVVEGKLS